MPRDYALDPAFTNFTKGGTFPSLAAAKDAAGVPDTWRKLQGVMGEVWATEDGAHAIWRVTLGEA